MLRAVHEAGVKIDIVAGHGMGAATAMLAAVDGAGRLWDRAGFWRQRHSRFYWYRTTLRVAFWAFIAALAALLIPAALVLLGLIVYPLGFLIGLMGTAAGTSFVSSYATLIDAAIQPTQLPTLVPRIVTVAVLVAIGALGAAALHAARGEGRRRQYGSAWWAALGAPLTSRDVTDALTRLIAAVIGGAAAPHLKADAELATAYSELVAENLGQPGFRELLVVAHDLDTRRDVVFVLLADGFRSQFFLRRGGFEGERRLMELVDLAGAGRHHALDAVAAALALPLATPPHAMTFAPESYWRGETHRLCDRPGAVARLLDEAVNAGAEQIILVSATPETTGPHRLASAPRDPRRRFGELLSTLDAASVREGLALRGRRVRTFLIRPLHNPIGPFDIDGRYDERSDRLQTVSELVDRGYDDAHRQFIDPVVGASGEGLGEPAGDAQPTPGGL